jgi:TPR repeat protein
MPAPKPVLPICPVARQARPSSFRARNAIIILALRDCQRVDRSIGAVEPKAGAGTGKNKQIEHQTLPTATRKKKSSLIRAKKAFPGRKDTGGKVSLQGLAIDELPEAMYEYGNLTLLNEAGKQDCAEAMSYLKRAANRGYVPAKRTVGFLYSFASDSMALKQKGYQLCGFAYDIPRGSRLLMEAALQGDTISGRLLQELNTRFGKAMR